MKQKINRKFFMTLVIAAAFFLQACDNAQNSELPPQEAGIAEHYEYPSELTGMSTAQKVEQCRIPEEELSFLSGK